MGLIASIFGLLFGSDKNVIRETAEVFRPNAEAEALREAARFSASLAQFSTEFALPKAGLFDRLIDGVNRLPRPAMALGTLALFISAMTDPVWFAERMQGLQLVPEPLWWLLGAIVTFYFGARHQFKTHDLQARLASALANSPEVARTIAPKPPTDIQFTQDGNAALDEWKSQNAR